LGNNLAKDLNSVGGGVEGGRIRCKVWGGGGAERGGVENKVVGGVRVKKLLSDMRRGKRGGAAVVFMSSKTLSPEPRVHCRNCGHRKNSLAEFRKKGGDRKARLSNSWGGKEKGKPGCSVRGGKNTDKTLGCRLAYGNPKKMIGDLAFGTRGGELPCDARNGKVKVFDLVLKFKRIRANGLRGRGQKEVHQDARKGKG